MNRVGGFHNRYHSPRIHRVYMIGSILWITALGFHQWPGPDIDFHTQSPQPRGRILVDPGSRAPRTGVDSYMADTTHSPDNHGIGSAFPTKLPLGNTLEIGI